MAETGDFFFFASAGVRAESTQAPPSGGTASRDKEIKKLNEEIERLKKKLAGEKGSGGLCWTAL